MAQTELVDARKMSSSLQQAKIGSIAGLVQLVGHVQPTALQPQKQLSAESSSATARMFFAAAKSTQRLKRKAAT